MRAMYPPLLGAVSDLDLVAREFLESDLQVVLRTRLDHRRRVLIERTLAEVVVVRVDLAGALGGCEHYCVVRVVFSALEKGVQSGLDHVLVMVATSRLSSSTAASRSSLTTTWSNSSSAASSSRATPSRRSIWSELSEPRPTSRV